MKVRIFVAIAALTATGAVAAPPADDTAAPAASAGPAEQASTAAANAEADAQDEKKICRTERATGSLTRRTRVCMTVAQWREINSKTYRGVTEMQGQAAGGTNSSFSSAGSGQ